MTKKQPSAFAAIESALTGAAPLAVVVQAPEKPETKPGKAVVAVALPAKLETIAAEISGALQETASLSESLGAKAREAGAIIAKKPDLLDPFIDAVRQLCAAVGLADGSVKVYLSNMRGVLRAMIGGWSPDAGMGLRAMYDAAPKGTGRQKATGPMVRMQAPARASANETADDDAEESSTPAPAPAPAKQSPAEIRRAAIVALFGHFDESLDAMMDYIVEHETKALRWVESEIVSARNAASAPVRGGNASSANARARKVA